MSDKTIDLYGLKSCDTCKKAQKALSAAGFAVTFIDVRDDGVPDGVLSGWLAAHGADVLVNTRSTTWRGLDASDRGKADTNEGALDLLKQHPTLMKRPVLVVDGASRVGWSKQIQADLL
jgi:arsenate reductase